MREIVENSCLREENLTLAFREQYYEILSKSSPELGKHVLTVSFSEDSPEKMAELIGLALNLKCTRNQNIITLSE